MDFGFTRVYTPAILKFIYFMAVPGLLIVWGALTGIGFHYGTWWGLGGLVIAGPAIFIGTMLVLRVGFEVILVSMRAADDLHAMRVSGAALPARSAAAPRPRPAG